MGWVLEARHVEDQDQITAGVISADWREVARSGLAQDAAIVGDDQMRLARRAGGFMSRGSERSGSR